MSLDDNSTPQPAGAFESLPASGPPPWPALDRLVEQPRRKFQHRYRVHIALFICAFFTMSWAGIIWYANYRLSLGDKSIDLYSWPVLLSGLWYSIPLLTILAAHEFGHYVFCRHHDVDATLPFFIPAPPFLLTGTLGAVIRIKEAFPSTRALFDIGVAGPIAGFVVLVPFLYIGLLMSGVATFPKSGEIIFFGEPLLFKLLAWLQFGRLPAGQDIVLHPMGFAAWFGMLATALNLLPFGQLDGGHIMYALFRRRSAAISLITLVAALGLTVRSWSWLAMTVMMVAMAFLFGLRHPRVIQEHNLDRGRVAVAALAVVIFVLCFTPVPMDVLFFPPAKLP